MAAMTKESRVTRKALHAVAERRDGIAETPEVSLATSDPDQGVGAVGILRQLGAGHFQLFLTLGNDRRRVGRPRQRLSCQGHRLDTRR